MVFDHRLTLCEDLKFKISMKVLRSLTSERTDKSAFTHLDTVHGGSQSLLQLGQFAAQVRIIPHQLFVHLRQLIQIVLQETDLLFLRERASVVFVVLSVHRLHKETRKL